MPYRRICNFKTFEFSFALNHQEHLGIEIKSDGETDFSVAKKVLNFWLFMQ
jgi:hypothetical protein